MSKEYLPAGTTSFSAPIFVQDTSKTDGSGLAIATNTAGLVAEYRRAGQSAWTPITPVAGTLGTYSAGKLVADGALSGAMEFDIPDAALAVAAPWVQVRLRGAANMLPVLLEYELYSNGGVGANAVTVHFADSISAANLAGAAVRWTGAMVPAPYLLTDTNGNAAFGLNGGTYTLTATLGGYLPYSGTQNVSGSATLNLTLVASVLPIAGVGQVTGQLQTYDGQGNLLAAGQVQFELVSSNNGTNQASFSREVFTLTADGGGNLAGLFEQNSGYRGRRLSSSGHGAWINFSTPTNSTTFALPQILGYLGT